MNAVEARQMLATHFDTLRSHGSIDRQWLCEQEHNMAYVIEALQREAIREGQAS